MADRQKSFFRYASKFVSDSGHQKKGPEDQNGICERNSGRFPFSSSDSGPVENGRKTKGAILSINTTAHQATMAGDNGTGLGRWTWAGFLWERQQ